jgi:hypothetical protein
MMARFRCGDEERESRYWMEGEERGFKMYYVERERERETIEHMWNKCSELREREGENGKGRNSEERRKDKMDERDK